MILNGVSLQAGTPFRALGRGKNAYLDWRAQSEINFWNPDPETGRLLRTAKIPDTIPGLSRFQQTILHQGQLNLSVSLRSWQTDSPSLLARVETHLLEDASVRLSFSTVAPVQNADKRKPRIIRKAR